MSADRTQEHIPHETGLAREVRAESDGTDTGRRDDARGNGGTGGVRANESRDLESITDAVVRLVRAKHDESPLDVYVWSDGSVTNSETPPDDETHLVAVFSPTDDTTPRAEIVETLRRGFSEVNH